MQLTKSLALTILALTTTTTTVLAAPSLHDRTGPPSTQPSAQDTTCSQNVGVQSCCSGPVKQVTPSTTFFNSLLAQNAGYAGVIGILLEGLLGNVLGGGLGGIVGGKKVGVAQQCTSTGVLSVLSGTNVVNCGSVKPKCCVSPKNNSPSTTTNNGLIVANVQSLDLIFCPDVTVLGS